MATLGQEFVEACSSLAPAAHAAGVATIVVWRLTLSSTIAPKSEKLNILDFLEKTW